jgi:hypothetical protein
MFQHVGLKCAHAGVREDMLHAAGAFVHAIVGTIEDVHQATALQPQSLAVLLQDLALLRRSRSFSLGHEFWLSRVAHLSHGHRVDPAH